MRAECSCKGSCQYLNSQVDALETGDVTFDCAYSHGGCGSNNGGCFDLNVEVNR